MQLMCRHSEENDTECLGIFDEEVRKFSSPGAAYKVPQMGWNTIHDLHGPLFTGLPEETYGYFVHSYYAAIGKHTIATTDYILPYSAALHRDNFYGVQFHPEKSALAGEQIIKNFLDL
jgi:glutamine amidotransferase